MKNNENLVLEIGTSKIVALLGTFSDNKFYIYGKSETFLDYLSKNISFTESINLAVCKTISDLEKQTNRKFDSVSLIYSGNFSGEFNSSFVDLKPEYIVTNDIINKEIEKIKNKKLSDDKIFVNHFSNGFYLDETKIANAINRTGEKLRIDFFSIIGNKNEIYEKIEILNVNKLTIKYLMPPILCASQVITSTLEREKGVLVIDIGSGKTEFILYLNNRVISFGIINLAGNVFTNDIKIGIGIEYSTAEKLKTEFGTCLEFDDFFDQKINLNMEFLPNKTDFKKDTNENTSLAKDLQKISNVNRRIISKILQIRLEELFEIIKKEISCDLSKKTIGSGIIITGGSSKLKGIEKLASKVFRNDVFCRTNKLFEINDSSLEEPKYSGILGALII